MTVPSIFLSQVIKVEGLSSTALAETLRTKLLKFMTAPQVSVFVKVFNSKKIYVFGEVRKPGTFPFEDGMTIVQAITLAGGFDKLADQNGTFINRVIDGSETKIEVSVKDIEKGRAPIFSSSPAISSTYLKVCFKTFIRSISKPARHFQPTTPRSLDAPHSALDGWEKSSVALPGFASRGSW